MASKRANAIKTIRAQEELNDRMAAIEESQRLIMEKLGISIPVDEVEEPIDDAPVVPEGDPFDYGAMSPDELEAEAKDRGIYEGIVGSGKDGYIKKDDLVAALTADDAPVKQD